MIDDLRFRSLSLPKCTFTLLISFTELAEMDIYNADFRFRIDDFGLMNSD